MFLVVSKLTRKDAQPCTKEKDIDTELFALNRQAYDELIDGMQSQGKIVYRTYSINASNEVETVTLYQSEIDYMEYKSHPAWFDFEAQIDAIYNRTVTKQEV